MNGEWTLGTRGSPWLLEVSGKTVASGRDEERTWAGSLEVLRGHIVKRVAIRWPGPDLSIELDGGYRFLILASKDPEWQAWELFCPDGSTVVVWCDGRWTEGRRDQP